MPSASAERGHVPVLEARAVSKFFKVRGPGLFSARSLRLRAVQSLDLAVHRGEIVGIVGETGSGKSTLGRLLLRLLRPSAGSVLFGGRDISGLQDRAALASFRRAVQCVFQNPYSSLSPRRRVGKTMAEPLEFTDERLSAEEQSERVLLACEAVGLPPTIIDRYPHELSGGQRQRIAIARATITNPACIVLDEPVSALDLSIQAQVLNLLADLHEKYAMAYVLIAHDLAIVRHLCQRVLVMYLGRAVEIAPADDIYAEPLHPYTQALLSSVIRAGTEARTQAFPVLGELPSPLFPPPGCPFSSRCPAVMEICRSVEPPLSEVSPGRWVACHLHADAREV